MNTKILKTTGLMAALFLTSLLAACGGGGGGSTGTATTTGGTTTPATPTALLQINGTNATSTTNTVTSADNLVVSATAPVKWSFTATMANGQPDTTSQHITSLEGLQTPQPNPDALIPDPVTGVSSFYIGAMPGDTVTMTLTDPNTGAVVASYVFDVNSGLAGNWSMNYTYVANNIYDTGTCSFTVSLTGAIQGSCASSNVAGETFSLTGQQTSSYSVVMTGSNGWTFTNSSITPTSLSGTINNGGSNGSWTASRS